MPQLVLFALLAVAVIIGWRIVKREMSRVEDKLKKTRGNGGAPKEIETLEKDRDGVYRPKK